MTKGDIYTREIFQRILDEGCMDVNPRPHYADGTPAHTFSVNHGMCTYDLSKNESPLITLRPIAIKSSIGELLWIYQKQSNDLNLLKDKYNITWWDDWDIGDRTIGASYGHTVATYYNMHDFLDGIKNDPDGRRHIISLWQEDEFKQKHGLKPCAFLTMWNVRHGKDGNDYLDMCLVQRSSDFATAGCINQVQYTVFLLMVARHLGYKPGRFTWFYNNIHLYDRHIKHVKEMLQRESVDCNPIIELNPEKTDFFDFEPEDVIIKDYPIEVIKEKNPQFQFDLGI